MDDSIRNLKICIIGAGMGGLTCALALAKRGFQDIHVFEYAKDLGFVGAGIQLAPNMARILDRLGVWSDIERQAVVIKDTSIRQGSTDSELGHVDLAYLHSTYGYPHMVGHRSSLASSIYEGCLRESAIKFHFSTNITHITSFSPRPTFTATPKDSKISPYQVNADVLLAADGVKSMIRPALLEKTSATAEIIDSGQAAYRIMLDRDQLQGHPDLLKLMDTDRATRWIGERRHIIAYPVSNNTIYNISTAQPDVNFAAAPSATYTTRGSKKQMLSVYADFCPMIHKMLDLVPEGEVCEWKLRYHSPLPTWVHGSVALVGDACHPTLPHLAQGAAQAIEDAAVLGVVLSRLPDPSPGSIRRALKVYERVRKDRAEALVEMAAANGRSMHLGEGAAKEERDKQFAALKQGKGPVPDKWADADVQRMIYGHDCMNVAEEEFQSLFEAAT